jgi:hypothetical protein
VILPDFPSNLMSIKFILGTPPILIEPTPEEIDDRAKLLEDIQAEVREYGDMVMLPVGIYNVILA